MTISWRLYIRFTQIFKGKFYHTHWELRLQIDYFIMYCFSSTECTFQRCWDADYSDDIASMPRRSTLLKKCTGGDGFYFCRDFNEGKSRLLYTADHKMFSRGPRTANNTSNDLHTDFVSNPLAIIFDDLLVVSHDGVLGIGQGLHHFVSGLYKAFHYRGQHQNPFENDTIQCTKTRLRETIHAKFTKRHRLRGKNQIDY